MAFTKEELKDLAEKGKELAAMGLAAANLIGVRGLDDSDKNATVLRIITGTIDSVQAIAVLINGYAGRGVDVPDVADLEAQLAALRAFKPLPV